MLFTIRNHMAAHDRRQRALAGHLSANFNVMNMIDDPAATTANRKNTAAPPATTTVLRV